MSDKKCLLCGKELDGIKRKYCSDKCGKKDWTINNYERHLRNGRNYYDSKKEDKVFRDKIRKKGVKSYHNNKEKRNYYNRQWYIDNPEYNKSYYIENKEEMRKYAKDNRIIINKKKYFLNTCAEEQKQIVEILIKLRKIKKSLKEMKNG